jgi:hypothetical protein
MTKAKKIVMACFVAVVFLIMILMIMDEAKAHHKHHDINIDIDTNSQPSPTSTSEPTIVTVNNTDSDISRGIALAGAVNHQFTFDTLRMQGSVVGAVFDSEQAVSFGLAKRFDSIDALWHGSVSIPDGGSDELVNFGATFRF